ncbi:Salicylate hydroxylase [Leucoagaricus sp. SymC.cos]|nr:Salicylate hydroxylase [Leucoagaricus sp. SymC.cos]
MSSKYTPLHVAVVGGGLGGLAVAVALRQQGHRVEIFEASATNTELGLGITVPPNGSKALDALGYNIENTYPTHWRRAMVVHQGGHPPMQRDMEYFTSTFGRYWYVCGRRALHDELKRLAFDEQLENTPCTIHLASPVASCDPERGTVVLKDGREFQFDLVVGADGIRSRIRQSLNPGARDPPPTGMCNFRFSIEKHLLESVPGCEWVMHEGDTGPRIWMSDARHHVFAYAIKCPERGDVLNVAAICDDRRDQSISKWRTDASRDELLSYFSDFDEKWQQLLRLAPPVVNLWQLRVLDQVQTWAKGKACILGDAAHAMFQAICWTVLGQGAAQAFEDAVLLGTLLPPGTSKSEVPAILKRWESIRKPRVQPIQLLSAEEMLSPVKQAKYYRSVERQLPVMGYDVVHEMARYKAPPVLRNREAEEGTNSFEMLEAKL